MPNIAIIENYKRLKEEIFNTAIACHRNPEDIKLVAVSKNQSWENIAPIYNQGCIDFGENKLQEALPKIKLAPHNCRWHFIGPLQKNKVKKTVENFALIHSVDSLELAKKISEISLQLNVISSILLQVNTSKEESKQGMTSDQCFHDFPALMSLPGLNIQGLMTIAPFVENESIIRHTFKDLRLLRDKILLTYHPLNNLPDLSMGMSHDFKLAIAEGATILRIGTKIWPQGSAPWTAAKGQRPSAHPDI